ncbi:hypothetical protein RBY4I_3342 [Rhodobacterales bacterium Y4I]|nr:hypothetical protein RBY4I_3342 [Rhodobacterales bacterium Y4I]
MLEPQRESFHGPRTARPSRFPFAAGLYRGCGPGSLPCGGGGPAGQPV